MKKLLCTLAALALCLALAAPALADDAGYRVDKMDVQAQLHENNVMSVTETITVTFDEPRHGIVRVLPEKLTMLREVDGEERTMYYRAKVGNVTATGAPAKLSSENGSRAIRLGNEDEWVTSAQYVLEYDYDLGDDRIPAYDQLFYSLNGPDWDAEIEELTFSIAFDKPLPAEGLETMTVLGGAWGATADRVGIEWTADENGVRGATTRPLHPGESVSVYAKLPAGYFVGARLPVTWPFWVFGGLAAALCLYILARAFATQQPKAAPGFVTAPPDGISPAEVGYIIDGSADDSDLVSLILQFAQQGLVTLENVPDEKGAILVLHKKGELPAAAPDYQRTFWQGLFPLPDSTVCDMGEWKPEFFETMQQAKQQLAATFQGGRQLDRKGTAAQAILLPLAVCALYLAAVLFSGGMLVGAGIAGAVVGALALLLLTVLASVYGERRLFASRGASVGFAAGMAAMVALAGGMGLVCAHSALVPPLAVLGLVCLAAAACLMAPRIVYKTEYGAQVTGELLALRRYMAEEAPASAEEAGTFYALLPYAYVFGLAEHWAKRFEAMTLGAPAWWNGAPGEDMLFTPYWMCGAMCHGFSRSMHSLAETYTSTQSSSTGGVSSGGFTGGGFGGGGGHAW